MDTRLSMSLRSKAGAQVPGQAESEGERRVEEACREAAVIKDAAEGERERMLEGARTLVEETRRETAAVLEAAREAAASAERARLEAEQARVESRQVLDAARMEAEEARLEGAREGRREAAAIQEAAESERGRMLDAARMEAAQTKREAAASAEWERGRMLEAARLEGRREAAAMQEAAERESGRLLDAARMEADETKRVRGSAERESGAMLHAARMAVEEGRRVREAADARMLEEVAATLAAAQQEAAGIVEAAEGERVAAQGAAQGRQVRVLFYGELEAVTEGFSIDRRIGGGGFGNVYKAVGLEGVGECAVKRLEEGSMQGQREFLQELQMLGGCRHKNVLTLLAFSADRAPGGAGGGGVCLVSPLMHGGSLEDRLFPLSDGASARLALLGVPPQPAPLAWNVRLRIGVEIASALEYLHSIEPGTHKPQVFHRDVKPANVLLDADLHVRLGDVGLARALAVGGTHVTTQVAGTSGFIDHHYQTTGRFDASCDGFSFGVVLLMLFTGRPSFDNSEGVWGGTLIDSCMGRAADVLRDLSCGWPLSVAEEVQARRLLEAAASAHAANPPGQGGAVQRECFICWAPPTVRFGCGHSFLCGADACLGVWLAQHKPCPHCGAAVEQGQIEQGAHVAQQDTFVAPPR
ncbi:kinase-like domain-containing protein [Baffinella frigidus]|nr:kinase-like domain-containing protein [Cryptophyta sp. CCMP2293]